jgi:hypothetical protein
MSMEKSTGIAGINRTVVIFYDRMKSQGIISSYVCVLSNFDSPFNIKLSSVCGPAVTMVEDLSPRFCGSGLLNSSHQCCQTGDGS